MNGLNGPMKEWMILTDGRKNNRYYDVFDVLRV